MLKIPTIARQEPLKCELCGQVKELRPYGPRGENVCFDCGMKNEKAATRQMKRVLYGETEN